MIQRFFMMLVIVNISGFNSNFSNPAYFIVYKQKETKSLIRTSSPSFNNYIPLYSKITSGYPNSLNKPPRKFSAF